MNEAWVFEWMQHQEDEHQQEIFHIHQQHIVGRTKLLSRNLQQELQQQDDEMKQSLSS